MCVYLDSVGRLFTGVYVWVLGLCSGEFVVHLWALAFFEVCVCVCVCLLVFACVGVCVDLCMCVCWFRWYYLVVRCVYVCVLILMFLFALLCVLLFYIVCIWWCSPCVDTFFDGCVCPQGLGFVWLSYMCTWGWCDVMWVRVCICTETIVN